ncbi:MAG TPA: CotH kinase family protein [Polyangiales bacterium]|nr:CotH kinase family protein [Polyangiales bacterium]
MDGGTIEAQQAQNAVATGDASIDAAMSGDAGARVPKRPVSRPSVPEPDTGLMPAAPLCMPSGGGPYALLEGETLNVAVSCSTGASTPSTLSFEALPKGAVYTAASATLTWTPGLDQAGRYELQLRDERSEELGTVRLDVVDRFDTESNQPVDASRYHEEYGLPVFHLTTDPGLNDDNYTPATIVYRGHSYAGAEAKLRGASSLAYPKPSFTLKFTKADKFSEPGFAGGFFKKRKITLTTTFDDNSYVRQRLGYELWNRLDPSHIKVQTYNAVLFLNGEYFGLYTVTDHVDGYLMEDFGLRQDGDLYKARSVNANFRATRNGSQVLKETLHEGFTKEEGLPEAAEPGAFDNLEDFVRWVNDAMPEQLAAEADSRIAVRDYEDWWIFVSFIAADDSVTKNAYHYRDPALAGSLWRFVPWDLNHSFGQQWNTERASPTVTRPEGLYPQMNNLFEKLLAGPRGGGMRQRYAETLARDAFALDRVSELFDAMVAEVDASAHRDEQLWGAKYRSFGRWNTRTDFTSFEQEIQYVRQWIKDRHAYLESLYPAAP